MPVSLLIALLIAFGVETPPGPVLSSEILRRSGLILAVIGVISSLAFALGGWAKARVARGADLEKTRRRFGTGSRILTVLSIGAYAAIIHSLGWSRIIHSNWGLRDWFLVDDVLVFLPFAALQLLVWSGLFAGEQALKIAGPAADPRLWKRLVLRSRQSIGLILPVVLLYLTRRDLIARIWPSLERYDLAEPLELSLMGGLVLLGSPLFVRIAWPTRSLPAGPLRSRLEKAAARVNFRYTDILVWDTGQSMVNACVTGVLPQFRYVLLTDALIDTLTPLEASAVFGHEVGHVVHRHMPYLGFFFMGSLGVFSLLATAISATGPWLERFGKYVEAPPGFVTESIQGSALFIILGLYFWVVFGRLSRRFERQADVFGAKMVSCQTTACPPHVDLDENHETPTPRPADDLVVCPVGARVFADALATVAVQNGLDPNGRSWRHGTIASRLDFLGWLERNPAAERGFQAGTLRFRIVLGLVLSTAVIAAVVVSLSWQ